MPKRIQRSRRKGWRMPPNTVNVARPSKWGNPFIVGQDGSRERCVALYRALAEGFLCRSDDEHIACQKAAYLAMQHARTALRGKDLACWCPLNAPCHADVLLEIANDGKG